MAANLLLIPRLGIVGAALATLASYMVMAAGLFYFAQKFYGIPYEYGKIVKILAAIFACGALYYYLYFHGGLEPVRPRAYFLPLPRHPLLHARGRTGGSGAPAGACCRGKK